MQRLRRPSCLTALPLILALSVFADRGDALTVTVIGTAGTIGADGVGAGQAGEPGGAGDPATAIVSDPEAEFNKAVAIGGAGGGGGDGGEPGGAAGAGGQGGAARAC